MYSGKMSIVMGKDTDFLTVKTETHDIKIMPKGKTHLYVRLLDGGIDILHNTLYDRPSLCYPLFFYMVSLVKPWTGNLSYFPLKQVMEKFNLARATIYRGYKGLLDADLIRKVKKGTYLLNPNVVFYGKERDRQAALLIWNNHELPKIE